MFWKKKKPQRVIRYGVSVEKCSECKGPTRPCLVDDKPATFHRWVDEDRAFLRINILLSEREQRSIWREFQETGYVHSGCSTEVQRVTVALVEYSDGSVGKVKPELVQFTDHDAPGENLCICCGAVVPEGRQVCPTCEGRR